ncbi:MAG: SAM-dependent methyltransferase, partial [Planctomycetia bacterium]|nr:SAM-dependent methyltransferase [Planctomycetia bacterium]
MDRQAHWQRVYTTKKPAELSWYQPEPEISLHLLTTLPCGEGRIIDVGGGESCLVDRMLQADYTEITVLDVSPAA